MRRNPRLFRIVLLAGALLPAGASAQDPKSKENLFPTGEGSTWEFAGKAGAIPLKLTAKITSSTVEGNRRVVRVEWLSNGQPTQEEEYLVTPSEVARSRSGAGASNTIDPPIPVIRYPMAAGKSWKWKGVISMGSQKAGGSATLKVVRRETVKIKGRPVNAWRVDLKLTVSVQGRTLTIPNTYWFAPGAGLVKQRATISAGGKTMTMEGTVSKYTIK